MDTGVDHGDYMSSLNSIDSIDVDSAALNPDLHFFVMLRYGLLALQLLPDNSISGAWNIFTCICNLCLFCIVRLE